MRAMRGTAVAGALPIFDPSRIPMETPAVHPAVGEPRCLPGAFVVVSPHLDDAVFSCAGLLRAHPGSVVITAYTGLPQAADMSTDWDRRCGFPTAADAMAARLAEDRLALAQVGCMGLGLGFVDSQYGEQPPDGQAQLADSLVRVLAGLGADRVALPLGLFHDDHVRVSDAGLDASRACPGLSWFFYEDVPYRKRPGAVQARLAQLRARGVVATPAPLKTDLAGKADAVSAYASQLRGLGGLPDAGAQAESYWRVAGGEEPRA
ncbi:PIG-L family deacetylase [Achromobacter sp. HZ01]|uniref:PIG-L family deacetylase n=1 Tax=Achromobacter sp. HZ01 TaxID=1416886 RepID=UPI00143D205B|nr:PIG-L family deacetylase [Achromobacter sp. HZ01]